MKFDKIDTAVSWLALSIRGPPVCSHQSLLRQGEASERNKKLARVHTNLLTNTRLPCHSVADMWSELRSHVPEETRARQAKQVHMLRCCVKGWSSAALQAVAECPCPWGMAHLAHSAIQALLALVAGQQAHQPRMHRHHPPVYLAFIICRHCSPHK